MKNIPGLITEDEKKLAKYCMDASLKNGASQARVSLSKSVLDSYSMLNGILDKVTHSADRSIFLYIFADGKYGTYSTNMLEEEELETFTKKAVEATRLLAEDGCRCLPPVERTAANAVTGRELGLYDTEYENITPEMRLSVAEDECIFNEIADKANDFTLISEEVEYSDSVDDNYLIDSQGFCGRHTETSFALCSEITLSGSDGRKYSGYWWDSSPYLKSLPRKECSETALKKALDCVGPKKHKGGKMKMVVDRSVSSRLISPVISALNASSIQQKSSFLEESLGKQVFPEGLTLSDLALTPGKPGSRLFDTEGVATSDSVIIEKGVVNQYFTNTYMALKMGIDPTVEGISRPVLSPFRSGWQDDGQHAPQEVMSPEQDGTGWGVSEILGFCKEGILVTGFNGGNCNPSTGCFSYGIEGFAFRNGKITHPVKEMVITGEMISLWQGLIAAGNDARECTRWQIPTLAFEGVDFSA